LKDNLKFQKTKIILNGDGTYDIAYTPNVSGKYLIGFIVGGKDIIGSPFFVNVVLPADPINTIADGTGLKDVETGIPTTFTIRPKDSEGNNVITMTNLLGEERVNDEEFQVVIDDPEKIDPKIILNDDETYAVYYIPKSIWKYCNM